MNDNKILFIMGNGPSLGEVMNNPDNLQFIKQHHTFGLNAAYRAYEKYDFWPTYFGCFDYLVNESHKDNFSKLVLTDNNIKEFYFIGSASQKQNLFNQNVVSNPKFKKFNFITGNLNNFTSISNDLSNIKDIGSSGANSLQIGIMKGYKNIVLLGCDCNYIEKIDEAISYDKNQQYRLMITKNVKNNPNYWFNEYQQIGDKYNLPNTAIFQHKSWLNISKTLPHNVKIINCSQISKIPYFKKESFEIMKNNYLSTQNKLNNKKFKILLTCPPMIKQIDNLQHIIDSNNLHITIPDFTGLMNEEELCKIIGNFDGWIIGDDPCTEKVIQHGIKGNLKALVKWGVGVDNVDFDACKKYNIPVSNTPAMFGEEVSDIAINYLLTLTRETHLINKKVREGIWFKPTGRSLSNKKVALIGFGDIGRCVARKCLAFNLNVSISDPAFYVDNNDPHVKYKNLFDDNLKIDLSLHTSNRLSLADTIEEAVSNSDYIIVTCSLNNKTRGLLNKKMIQLANKGVIIINVARGPVIVEKDVIELLENKFIKSVGFDVFEIEPLNKNNNLLKFEQNIYGSHNSSNTLEAVLKTSKIAINKLTHFLNK